jgi:hypothetical protein
MSLDGLTPEQREFILDLNKRVQALETKLLLLQGKIVKIDPALPASLVNNISHFNLN